MPAPEEILEILNTQAFKDLFREAVASKKVKLCTSCQDLKQFVIEQFKQLGYDEKVVEQYWKKIIYPKLVAIYNNRDDMLKPTDKTQEISLVTLANVLYFALYEQTEDAPRIMYELLEPYMVQCLSSASRDACIPVRQFFIPVDGENIDYVLKLLHDVLNKYPQLRSSEHLNILCSISSSMPKVTTINRKKIKDVYYCRKELTKIIKGEASND